MIKKYLLLSLCFSVLFTGCALNITTKSYRDKMKARAVNIQEQEKQKWRDRAAYLKSQNYSQEQLNKGLMKAIETCNSDDVAHFLNLGADPNHIADEQRHIPLQKFLISHSDYCGGYTRDAEIIKMRLEETTTNFHHKDINGHDTLYIAFLYPPHLTARLEDSGMKLSSKDANELLDKTIKDYWAGKKLENLIVEKLLRRGADPNRKLKNGNTYLHLFVEKGDGSSMIRDFISEGGADVNIKNNDGATPADIAEYKYLSASNEEERKKFSNLAYFLEKRGGTKTGWGERKHAQEVEIARKQAEERARRAREEEARRDAEYRENYICLQVSGSGYTGTDVYITAPSGYRQNLCTRKKGAGRYGYEIHFKNAEVWSLFGKEKPEENWTCSGTYTVSNPDTHKIHILFSASDRCRVINVEETTY